MSESAGGPPSPREPDARAERPVPRLVSEPGRCWRMVYSAQLQAPRTAARRRRLRDGGSRQRAIGGSAYGLVLTSLDASQGYGSSIGRPPIGPGFTAPPPSTLGLCTRGRSDPLDAGFPLHCSRVAQPVNHIGSCIEEQREGLGDGSPGLEKTLLTDAQTPRNRSSKRRHTCFGDTCRRTGRFECRPALRAVSCPGR